MNSLLSPSIRRPLSRLTLTLQQLGSWASRNERACGIAGLVLAALLVLLLSRVLLDDLALLQQTRANAQLQAQAQYRCQVMADRLSRETCSQGLLRR